MATKRYVGDTYVEGATSGERVSVKLPKNAISVRLYFKFHAEMANDSKRYEIQAFRDQTEVYRKQDTGSTSVDWVFDEPFHGFKPGSNLTFALKDSSDSVKNKTRELFVEVTI